ncbi:chemotaxis protein CheW [Paraferrimonas sp. SM1919]|uniref:chemotaxis protein CheW n=1 Tax=Paraferrimonas sp. SM1919 TaxID=2662263 RepID=UPI0013CF8902|nr:chemotaxis protein CheW [Paraferrimonas sp. SM1919]
MSKHAQEAIEEYFSHLLQPQQCFAEDCINPQSVQLQKQLDLAQQQFVEPSPSDTDNLPQAASPLASSAALVDEVFIGLDETLDDRFQALFFKVGGLTIAIPLLHLGGIVNRQLISQLPGMPNWHLGVQNHRGKSLNVVDTYAWVTHNNDIKAEEYQYLIQLEESDWCLAAESLVETKTLSKADVKWRSQSGKRPWLAGIVKEQMCAIVYPQKLQQMCALGLNEQDQLGK